MLAKRKKFAAENVSLLDEWENDGETGSSVLSNENDETESIRGILEWVDKW